LLNGNDLLFCLLSLSLLLIKLDVVDGPACFRSRLLNFQPILHLLKGIAKELLGKHRFKVPYQDIFVDFTELSVQFFAFFFSLCNLHRILPALFFAPYDNQLDCLVLYADSHQLIFELNKPALTVHLLLDEIVSHKLVDTFIQVPDLDVLALDHAVEIGQLQVELVISLWVCQMLPHLVLKLLPFKLELAFANFSVFNLLF